MVRAFEKWLRELEKLEFRSITPEIREEILAYYGSQPQRGEDPKNAKASERSIRDAQKNLRKLQAVRFETAAPAATSSRAEPAR